MDFKFIKTKKKPKFHARPNQRTKDEVALQYNKAAISVGHLACEIQEHLERIEVCQQEIIEHTKAMRAARFEASKLPPEPKPEPAAPAAEGVPNAQA
jgi:mevalonate kinase